MTSFNCRIAPVKRSVVALAVLALQGCSTLGELPPDEIQNFLTKEERSTLNRRASCDIPCVTPIAAARVELEELASEISTLRELRMKVDQSFGEVSFWAGLLSVIGAFADKTALATTGAGTAAIGSTMKLRYKTEAFVLAFDRAEGRSECLLAATRDTSDEMLAAVLQSQSSQTPAVAEVARTVRDNLLATVEDIRRVLIKDIRRNRPETGVGATAIADAYRTAADASRQAGNMTPTTLTQKTVQELKDSQAKALGTKGFSLSTKHIAAAAQPRADAVAAPRTFTKDELQGYTEKLSRLSAAMKSCMS